jgi:hypothetical protein
VTPGSDTGEDPLLATKTNSAGLGARFNGDQCIVAHIHSVAGGVFRSVDMMIPRLLELRQRNEKKLAEGTLKMQDPAKAAASRLMI